MNTVVPLFLAFSLLSTQSGTVLRDPSPHQVRFVSVDTSVRLEVLDWGGSGRPILFVGCYLTAHVYDNIAPKLTDQFHVYAITRRGTERQIIRRQDMTRRAEPPILWRSCARSVCRNRFSSATHVVAESFTPLAPNSLSMSAGSYTSTPQKIRRLRCRTTTSLNPSRRICQPLWGNGGGDVSRGRKTADGRASARSGDSQGDRE